MYIGVLFFFFCFARHTFLHLANECATRHARAMVEVTSVNGDFIETRD